VLTQIIGEAGVETGAAYDAAAWESFAVAEVGAAAALAGLLVVATSINIARILEYPSVVSRLAAALALFTGVLVVGTLLLVPGFGRVALGIVLALVGVGLTAIAVRFRGTQVEREYRAPAVASLVVSLAATLSVIVAGVSSAAGAGGGLYWLAPGVLLAVAIGVVNAWVALVEILR
jgi:modulator of FtsH protease